MKINKYEKECDDINKISKKGEKNFLHISFDFFVVLKSLQNIWRALRDKLERGKGALD